MSEETNPVDFDSVLDQIGNFGKFQKILYYSVCFPIIFTTCLGLSVVFSAAIPKQRCFVPTCDTPIPQYQDAFSRGFANFTIPYYNGEYSKCQEFEFLNKTEKCTRENFDPQKRQKCTNVSIFYILFIIK